MITLRKTISLWVVRSRHCNSTIKLLHQRLPKPTLESSISITNYFTRHTKSTDPMFKKQLSYILSRNTCTTGYKTYQTTKTINNSKNSIITSIRYGQMSNKVHSNMLKWFLWILNRLKFTNWLLSWSFIGLTYSTTLTKLINTNVHLLPVKPLLCKLQQLLKTHMTTQSTTV
jgi:hypothetical protein